jgi:hypothetical protein
MKDSETIIISPAHVALRCDNRLPIWEQERVTHAHPTSLAWRCENLFAHQSSPSASHSPHHCPFTLVELSYGVNLFKDDYLLLLPAADLRMDPTLRPRPVSSVAFAYPDNALQLDHSIERRHI